jgi:hypothetical protein
VKPPVTFKTLHAHQREALKEWRRNVLDSEGPVGLWVYGHGRSQGSSTIATLALERMEWDGLDTEKVYCLRLTQAIRKSWGASEMSRHLPNDYDLYVDANVLEMQIERYWDVEVLLIDDLHEEQVDMGFWRRHVQEQVELRLKARKPTIIATDMAPNNPTLDGLLPTIDTLFVSCHAER